LIAEIGSGRDQLRIKEGCASSKVFIIPTIPTMAPKLPRKSTKHQVLAPELIPTAAASSASSIPDSIPADKRNKAIQLFRDFEYCHEKLFTIKSVILEELDAKELKELYSRLNNFLISAAVDCCGLVFADTFDRTCLTICCGRWKNYCLMVGNCQHLIAFLTGPRNF
jgi:hypothetical protein